VQTKRVVQFDDQPWCQDPEHRADPLDGDGPHLLGVRFRVDPQPGHLMAQQDLEGTDPGGFPRHRDDSDHTPSQPGRRLVGPVVADDDRRLPSARLVAQRRVQVGQPDLTAAHRPARH